MGHYNRDGMHMESAKQERHNLLHDNPVVKDASGGRPWISKHFQSTMSPLKDGHSGASPMEGNAFIKAKVDAEKAGAKSFVVDGETHPVKMEDDSKGMPKLYDAAGKMKYDAGNAMYDAPTEKKKCHHNV